MNQKKTDLLQLLDSANRFLGLALSTTLAFSAIPDRIESLIPRYKEPSSQLHCPRDQETTNVFKKKVLDERDK
jgi:hypothetical protein